VGIHLLDITITLLDEVNAHVHGIPSSVRRIIEKELSFSVKGAFQTVAYQVGAWDGKECYLSKDGFTYFYFVDRIIELLTNYGIPDDKIIVHDERKATTLPNEIPLVDENFLKEETGYVLRDYQVEGINKTLEYRKGVLGFATNAGKILINVGICKALDPYLKTISVVPNTHLAKQTIEEMDKVGLSSVMINDKIKPNDRQQAVNDHRHIVITKKLLVMYPELFKNGDGSSVEYGIIYDETHVFGGKMSEVFRFDLADSPIRVGMTGSFPTKDTNKAAMIKCGLGGDFLGTVKNNELINKGISSKPQIMMIMTDDPQITDLLREVKLPEDQWDLEFNYLKNNKARLDEILKYINNLSPMINTLILGHPSAIKYMAEQSNEDYITEDVSNDNRMAYFAKFRDNDSYRLFASLDTSATGVSEDDILRVILIDVGKNPTWILQSIGRGLRKSDKSDTVEVLDFYANLKYSIKHKKERVKIYSQEKFEFEESLEIIKVKGEIE